MLAYASTWYKTQSDSDMRKRMLAYAGIVCLATRAWTAHDKNAGFSGCGPLLAYATIAHASTA